MIFFANLPAATLLYVVLYVSTLILHVVLMGYVLGGSLMLACRALHGLVAPSARPPQVIDALLRDWLPFFLGAAITAGVAPLLFLQVLYKENFYTANLLLMHRFMAILPVLIVGFYLLYLLKAPRSQHLSAWGRLMGSGAAFAAFAFIGWTWTENHLLSLADKGAWVEFYRSGAWFYRDISVLPRFGLWLAGAVPIAATLLVTQIARLPRHPPQSPDQPGAAAQVLVQGDARPAQLRTLALWAWAGLLGAAVCWLLYPHGPTVQQLLSTPQGVVLACLATAAAVLHGVTWGWVRLRPKAGLWQVLALWFTLLSCIKAVCWLRESLRMTSLDLAALYPQHAFAARVDGVATFGLCAVVNSVLIAWCLTRARRVAL